MRKWKIISSREVYKNSWITVREDEIIDSDGNKGIYGVVDAGNGACIVPVDTDGKIWMVRSMRYLYGDSRWEFPAGGADEGENSEEAAVRELFEEAGLKAKTLKFIGQFRPSNGRMVQTADVFLAIGVEKVSEDIDYSEVEEARAFSLQEIDEMIKRGEILDGYVMCALYFYKLYNDSKDFLKFSEN